MIDKKTILDIVKSARHMSIRQIHKQLGLDPTDENDRVKVWKVGQSLAELVRYRFLHLQTSTGERVFYDF